MSNVTSFTAKIPFPRDQAWSRKKRRKARRYQAWTWRATKRATRNPMTGFITYMDQDTGLMIEDRTFADGSHQVNFSACGVGSANGALARLGS